MSSALDRLREAFGAVQASRPEFTDDLAEAALQQIVRALGGERVHIPKSARPRFVKPETAARVLADLPTGTREEVATAHGISRTTLYRLMKTGTKSRPKT